MPARCESHTTARTTRSGRPVHGAEEPGRRLARERRRGGAVDVEGGVRMALEERGRDLVVHLALDRPTHDGGLVLAGREDEDLAGLEDRGDAHRERLARDVLLAEEIGRRVLPGHQVERDEAGAALGARAGLVEADVPRPPDAEELEVDAAGLADRLLVAGDLVLHLRRGGCRRAEMWTCSAGNVELGEQVLPHEPMVGVEAPRVHRVVLVEIEGDDVPEAEPLVAVQADQLAVDADRRGAGGEPEHGAPALGGAGAYDLGDPARHQSAEVVVVVDDEGADALVGHDWSKLQSRRP